MIMLNTNTMAVPGVGVPENMQSNTTSSSSVVWTLVISLTNVGTLCAAVKQ